MLSNQDLNRYHFIHTHNIRADDLDLKFHPVEGVSKELLHGPAVYIWTEHDESSGLKICHYVGKTGIGVFDRFKKGHEPGFKKNPTGKKKAEKIRAVFEERQKNNEGQELQIYTRRSNNITLFDDQIEINGYSIEEEFFIKKFEPDWNVALVEKNEKGKILIDFSDLPSHLIIEEFLSTLNESKTKTFYRLIKKIEKECNSKNPDNKFCWGVVKYHSGAKLIGRGVDNTPCIVFGPKENKAGQKKNWEYRFYLTQDLNEIYAKGKTGRVKI